MLDENKELFDSFAKLHLDYSMDQDGLQDKFNTEGEKIMEIIRNYENRLCSNTERGMYNKFSGGLSEKFQEIVRAHFPLIDHVGLIVERPQTPSVEPALATASSEPEFFLKKIDL